MAMSEVLISSEEINRHGAALFKYAEKENLTVFEFVAILNFMLKYFQEEHGVTSTYIREVPTEKA